MSKRVTVRLTEEQDDQLNRMALKNNRTPSQEIRALIDHAVKAGGYEENEHEILSNIETALNNVLQPNIDRLAAISAKASTASAIDMLLTSFLLHRITPDKDAEKLEFFIKQIYLAGVNFVKAKDGGLEKFLLDTAHSIEEKWNK